MFTFTTTSEKVRVLGYFDLTLTIVTLVVVGYGFILPYSPYNSTASTVAESPKILAKEHERETPEILKPLDPFPFWLSVGLLVILGLIGILWSLVLIKISGLEETQVNEKYKMLGNWLLCSYLIAIVLTFLWIWVVFMGASNLYGNPAIQMSYGCCYVLRILLLFLVRRKRRNFSNGREMTDEDVERWVFQLVDNREGMRKAALGELLPHLRGGYNHKPFAKTNMLHGSGINYNLELKPYRGNGLVGNCKCVAPNANV